jgi:hypothetical protein
MAEQAPKDRHDDESDNYGHWEKAGRNAHRRRPERCRLADWKSSGLGSARALVCQLPEGARLVIANFACVYFFKSLIGERTRLACW